MRLFDKVAVGSFLAVAAVAFLIGIGTIVYAYVVVKPQLTDLNEEALSGIALAERTVHVLDAHPVPLNTLDAPQQSLIATARALPDVLTQSAYVSQTSAMALRRSANTLREIEEATGLILPDDAFTQNAEALSTAAVSVENLGPQFRDLLVGVDSLAGDLARATESAERLERQFKQANVTLAETETQLAQTRQAIESSDFPAEVARLASVHGGLYLVLAVLLAGMAGLWRRVALLAPEA